MWKFRQVILEMVHTALATAVRVKCTFTPLSPSGPPSLSVPVSISVPGSLCRSMFLSLYLPVCLCLCLFLAVCFYTVNMESHIGMCIECLVGSPLRFAKSVFRSDVHPAVVQSDAMPVQETGYREGHVRPLLVKSWLVKLQQYPGARIDYFTRFRH